MCGELAQGRGGEFRGWQLREAHACRLRGRGRITSRQRSTSQGDKQTRSAVGWKIVSRSQSVFPRGFGPGLGRIKTWLQSQNPMAQLSSSCAHTSWSDDLVAPIPAYSYYMSRFPKTMGRPWRYLRWMDRNAAVGTGIRIRRMWRI